MSNLALLYYQRNSSKISKAFKKKVRQSNIKILQFAKLQIILDNTINLTQKSTYIIYAQKTRTTRFHLLFILIYDDFAIFEAKYRLRYKIKSLPLRQTKR